MDQTAPSQELLEFLAESTSEGKDWIDPLTIKEMEDTGTLISVPVSKPAQGKQP